jgi:hypothetical protein
LIYGAQQSNFRWFYRQNPSWLNRYESVHKLEKIADIEGFAELTAQAVVTGLQDIKNEFDLLNQYDFNLYHLLILRINKDFSAKMCLNGSNALQIRFKIYLCLYFKHTFYSIF